MYSCLHIPLCVFLMNKDASLKTAAFLSHFYTQKRTLNTVCSTHTDYNWLTQTNSFIVNSLSQLTALIYIFSLLIDQSKSHGVQGGWL